MDRCKLIGNIDTTVIEALQQEIISNYELFDEVTYRQASKGSCHSATKTIFIREPLLADDESISLDIVLNRVDTDTTDVAAKMPITCGVMLDISRAVGGLEIGRVMLIALAGNSKIEPHVDEGLYPNYFRRYHLPIMGVDGTVFEIGEEFFKLQQGSVYEIGNNVYKHSVVNSSDEDRIHLVVDILTLGD